MASHSKQYVPYLYIKVTCQNPYIILEVIKDIVYHVYLGHISCVYLTFRYGVATVSRLLKMIGLVCRISSLL